MGCLDDFSRDLSTHDTKKKLSVGQSVIDHLGDPDSSLECEDLGAFVDGLVPWMQSSNFKVCADKDKERRKCLKVCESGGSSQIRGYSLKVGDVGARFKL